MSAGALSDGSAVVERLSGAEAGSIGFALRGRRLLCFTAVALRKSLRVKHGEMLASHCVKCCERINLKFVFQLFANGLPIVCQLLANGLPIVCQLLANYLPIVCRLLANHLPIAFHKYGDIKKSLLF